MVRAAAGAIECDTVVDMPGGATATHLQPGLMHGINEASEVLVSILLAPQTEAVGKVGGGGGETIARGTEPGKYRRALCVFTLLENVLDAVSGTCERHPVLNLRRYTVPGLCCLTDTRFCWKRCVDDFKHPALSCLLAARSSASVCALFQTRGLQGTHAPAATELTLSRSCPKAPSRTRRSPFVDGPETMRMRKWPRRRVAFEGPLDQLLRC